jgi:FkbM family methyltransferase
MLRRIAERLGRKKVFKRRLPSEFGATPLYISPDAQLKYLRFGRDAFDADLLRVASEEIEPNSTIWDIGANVGVFAFAAASRALPGGYVLAVEPDDWLASIIRKSASLPENGRLAVQVLAAAVSDKVGTSTLLIAERGRASNALQGIGRDQMGGVRDRVAVPTVTLDHLLNRYPIPDFLKIDVEGAEYQVLQGANRLLSLVRPKIYVEVGSELSDSVTAQLREHDYALLDPLSPQGRRTSMVKCAFNTLAVPKESL